MDITYKTFLIENRIVQESIPWRSGKVPIEIGKTSFTGVSQDCIVLNNLQFLFKMNPSFMVIVPEMNLLEEVGGGTNGTLILAVEAQQMEFRSLEQGKCKAKTYFFGRPKSDRTMDWYLRMYEKGFSIQNMEGLKTFPSSAQIDITVSKRAGYTEVPTGRRRVRKQKNYKIPCRIKRVS